MKFASINFRRAIRDFSEYNKLRNRLVNARIVINSNGLKKHNGDSYRLVEGGYSSWKCSEWLSWKSEIDFFCFRCFAEKVKINFCNNRLHENNIKCNVGKYLVIKTTKEYDIITIDSIARKSLINIKRKRTKTVLIKIKYLSNEYTIEFKWGIDGYIVRCIDSFNGFFFLPWDSVKESEKIVKIIYESIYEKYTLKQININ